MEPMWTPDSQPRASFNWLFTQLMYFNAIATEGVKMM